MKKNKKEISESKKKNKIKEIPNINIFLLLGFFFIITQSIGLFVANKFIELNVKAQLFTEDSNDPINAIYLFLMILLMTGIILLILKFRKKNNFLWIIEALAILSTSIIVFSAFFENNDLIVLFFVGIIFITRYLNKENILIKNIVSIIAISGAGAMVGISIGLIPVLIFIFILAIYDLIAVFGTKHMVTLGKAVTKDNFAFTITMPTKQHKFELGNGDLVIPLVTATSILASGWFNNNYLVSALVLIFSFIGLVFAIHIVSTKKIALPALPPQVFLTILVIIIATIIGL